MTNQTTKPALTQHIDILEAQAKENRATIRQYSQEREQMTEYIEQLRMVSKAKDRRIARLRSQLDELTEQHGAKTKVYAAFGFGAGWVICLLLNR